MGELKTRLKKLKIKRTKRTFLQIIFTTNIQRVIIMQFLFYIFLHLALSKDVKQKICSTSNCRKCDSYLSVANPHASSISKTNKAYQFCSRLLKLEGCCSGQVLHLGFMVELTCNPEMPSSSFNLEASIEAKEVNEIYSKAARDNNELITKVEEDIRDACKNTEQSFAVKNAPIFLILAATTLFILIIGTFALMHYHRKQLLKMKQNRRDYQPGTTESGENFGIQNAN